VIIIIGLCTFKRPTLLKLCLESLTNLKIPVGVSVEFVVIDNEPSDVVREIVEAASFVYLSEQKRGLVYARNMFLNYVSTKKSDYVGFIDDDEVVESTWLVDMLISMDETKADAVAGPVEIIIPENAPVCLKYAYQFSKVSEYKQSKTLPMGNVFFKTKLIENGLRFDQKFNHIGGEDIDFFKRAALNGALLMRSPLGGIKEFLTEEKASIYAFYKRVLRVARVHYKEKYPNYSALFFVEILLSFVEVLLFLMLTPVLVFSDKFKIKWVKVMAKFIGRLLSRKEITHHHYG
jgi:succinoglycan biosynthesis protein ExoM